MDTAPNLVLKRTHDNPNWNKPAYDASRQFGDNTDRPREETQHQFGDNHVEPRQMS